jgi:hypothetical protein
LVVPIGALLVLFFGVAVLAGLGGACRSSTDLGIVAPARRAAFGRSQCSASSKRCCPVLGGVVVGVVAGVALGGWLGSRTGLGASSILHRSIDGTSSPVS